MPQQEIATLGGGCFWCLEAVYQEMKGVESVVSGYMGGRMPYPTYEQVCRGNTGHIEVVQVTFDPGAVSYGDVLDVFFATHDPTTKDRQGNDLGEQYRSVIFYHSEVQKGAAESKIRELDSQQIWSRPIVTKVQPAENFYRAEDYHQNYYRTNPHQSYCAYIVEPKVRKFREKLKPLIAPAHRGNG
jgi:peptide-methionine (S)-S-oxide reductase